MNFSDPKPIYEIAVDFDGTIVTHKYPAIGEPVPMALKILRRLRLAGHRLILYTMRSGEYLEQAREYIEQRGVQLYGVNKNPTQEDWTSSPKAYAQIYIDDAALGTKLIYPEVGRPYVDWEWVEEQLILKGILSK